MLLILKRFALFLIFLCLSSESLLFASIDLEESSDSFILETKQIFIPGYPEAFNPSIINWKGSFLMSFRFRDPLTKYANQIGFVWLDETCTPVSSPQILTLPFHHPTSRSFAQDPRLIAVEEKLYLVYNDIAETLQPEIRRMFIAELHTEGEFILASEPESLLVFEGENSSRQEKNWAPFSYDGKLLLAYSQIPHIIFQPILGTRVCETYAKSMRAVNWKWGTLRGGTQALVVKGRYLAFFHSCKDMETVQSNGKRMVHYFMGAYTFEASPPFALTGVSKKPIIARGFYSGPEYNTWKPLRVVFPMGFVIDREYAWVVYGRQDHEAWVIKLDLEGLMRSLDEI